VLAGHTRVTTSVWVVSQPPKNHTFSARCNLESYAEGGIAVHLQNAAKTDWLHRWAWPVNDRSCETAAEFSNTPLLVELRTTAGLMLARLSLPHRQKMLPPKLCSTHPRLLH